MVHGLGVPSLGCPREVCLAWWRLTRRCDETRPNSWARKEKDCCGGGCGGVDGRRARRSLDAVFARRRRRSHGGYSGAPPRRRRQQLVGRCRPPQYLVAQARDTVAPPSNANLQRSRRRLLQAKPRANRPPAPRLHQTDANAPWPPAELGIGDWIQDWLARANREFQTTVIRRLSTAPAGGASDDEIARKLEEVKKQDARAAAAKRAEDERKAAEAKEAEQVKRQAAEAKRLRETREAADKAAQKAAEEASRKAAAEAARKAAEEAKAKPPPPPAPQPAAKPDDSARLAEEMRQERARLEAEASRIEEERKAAEAKRYAEERAQDEARIAEDRRRAAAAESEKNRTRKIVLTTEPIPQPEPPSVEARTSNRRRRCAAILGRPLRFGQWSRRPALGLASRNPTLPPRRPSCHAAGALHRSARRYSVAHFQTALPHRLALSQNLPRQPIDYPRSGPDLPMPADLRAAAALTMDFQVR